MERDTVQSTLLDSEAPVDPTAPRRVQILSVVYRMQTQTLGAAFLDQATIYYCQVVDSGPELMMMRSLKFELNPEVIVAPAKSDTVFLTQLEAPLETDAHSPRGQVDGDRDDDEDGMPGQFFVQLGKSRDFTCESATKRLLLLTHLFNNSTREMTDREALIHLDHFLPRDQEQARQAIGGLLAHLHKIESTGRLSITNILPHEVKHTMRILPEGLLSLNIFPDKRSHPSGWGRSRDSFSLWSVFNKTRSLPGEALLRSWFARPSVDMRVITERHNAISLFLSHQESLPQLTAIIAKAKDVRHLRASFDRGGMLLSDFKNALSLASCTIRMRDILSTLDFRLEDVPITARLEEVAKDELAELANMIAGIIDFESSAKREARLTKHICVHDGVHDQLDELRQSCAKLPHILTSTARAELARLRRSSALLHHNDDEQLYIVFITQLGFMLKMPMPRVLQENADSVVEQFAEAGLVLQFHEDGDGFFKTQSCLELDETFGDMLSCARDLESQLIRHLELQVLASFPAMLDAQIVLAELDCLLSLAMVALELNLMRPSLSDNNVLDIEDGWHPLLHNSPQLVPNSSQLNTTPNSPSRMILLTGPNASGKTCYLRMVGLIVFLAHVGSFVPARRATIGLTDAIYTRMISHESAVANASAFMVDLTQMAVMMRHSTSRSLCLVDEFGKGTNVQDGISYLYACLQHFLDRGSSCPHMLACTHFTELLELPELVQHPHLALWTMKVILEPKRCRDDLLDQVVFLYAAERGRSEDSYGYHCAAAADVPKEVIDRALYISERRDCGEPIYPIHRSKEDALAEHERLAARDALVDAFLSYDFNAGTGSDFFRNNAGLIRKFDSLSTSDDGSSMGTFG